ncbi:MAG TPA: lipid II flippase MurJ [Candidatus Saccharimonadales bacterium]|nr:lipid II flippase MurJ [Candidatus Saccharimonadales bacterium]
MNPPAQTQKPKRRVSISNVAVLLMATSLIGQVLGLLRTKLVNANFLALGPHSTDAYFAAFNIPDFFFFTLAAGALGVAFMPILSDRLHKGDRRGMWELSSSLLNLLALIMAAVGVLIFLFAKPLVEYVVAPSMTPEQVTTTATIMRLLAFNPLLFTVSGILTSMQQTLGRFFFFAIAPLFYNLSIIISAELFSEVPPHHGGPWHLGIVGLGLGAIIGALLQLLVVFAGMRRVRFNWRPRILWRSHDFHTVLRQLPPRGLDQGIDQLESIIETHFARNLGTGFVSYYNNAYTLSTAPILLIGTAISTAAFPRLNARLSQGRPDLFRKDFLRVLRAMIWITAPIVVIAFFARAYLARLIFTADDYHIPLILGYLVGAIFFGTLYTLLSRWFYAQKDTKTPLFVSVFIIALNIILVYMWAKPSAYGIAGLAIAQSVVAMVQVSILLTIMLIRDHQLFDRIFWGGCARIVSVSGFSIITGYVMLSFYPLGLHDRGIVTLGGKLLLISLVVISVHIAMSALFGLDEVRPLLERLKRIITKPVQINPF